MRKVSIIGATSPLGIDLATYLASGGFAVRASYRDDSRVPASFGSQITTQHLDLDEHPDFTPFLQGTVIWLAHIEQGRFNEREAETNIAAFRNFLDRAADSPVDKIVFISSGGSVYGEPREIPLREDHALAPLSSYGKAKAAMEAALIERLSNSDISTAILRPGNIYGFSDPNHDNKGIVAAFLNAIVRAQPFTLIHEGRTIRDFIHVEDVVRGIEAAIESERTATVWNVANGVGRSAADVLELLRTRVDLPMPEIRHVKNFASDVEQNILSIDRITRESNWLPKVSLDDGLRRTVASYLAATSE